MTILASSVCGLVRFADMSRWLTASTAASALKKAMPWLPFSTAAGVALWPLLGAIAFAQTLPPVSFYAARTFATNTAGSVAAESVVVGDFNGDGHLDMAVANSEYASGNVGVLLGKGDGTFRPAVNYAAGSDPVSVSVGDFNGDGHLDLAVADNDGGVSVLLGKGDGSFQAATNYATGTAPVWVAVGDFNGDGKLDLAVADFGISGHPDSGVSVLLGKGDGTFQTAVNYPAGIEPLSIAEGDFNGDGKPDLAVAGPTWL